MIRSLGAGFCLWGLFGAVGTATAQPSLPAFEVTVQRRGADGQAIKETTTLQPTRTAIVVVDMWDKHWCVTYTARVANLVPRMNQTLDAARKWGSRWCSRLPTWSISGRPAMQGDAGDTSATGARE